MLGRPLYAGEISDLMTVENIVKYYLERSKETNHAAWELQYPDKAALLGLAARACMEMYPNGD